MNNTVTPVLLVEDSEHEVRFMQRIWKKHNIANPLVVVHHGQQCLDYLRAENPAPSLILMDIRMPVMNGIECLRAIKSDASLAHIPVVMLTSSKDEEDLKQSFAEGCNTYIQKPSTFEDLTVTIEKICNYWELNVLP